MLILLDNAHTAEQVRALLPGSLRCVVIVTGRNRLAGLVARDGAHRINVDPLAPDDAIALLRQIVGGIRCMSMPVSVVCGFGLHIYAMEAEWHVLGYLGTGDL
jgi:hypothetical protein